LSLSSILLLDDEVFDFTIDDVIIGTF